MDQFYFDVWPLLLRSTIALNINKYGDTKSKAIIHQLLTEFISDNSLEKFLLLKSGNKIDALKKWKDEGKEDTQKRIRTIQVLLFKDINPHYKDKVYKQFFQLSRITREELFREIGQTDLFLFLFLRFVFVCLEDAVIFLILLFNLFFLLGCSPLLL